MHPARAGFVRLLPAACCLALLVFAVLSALPVPGDEALAYGVSLADQGGTERITLSLPGNPGSYQLSRTGRTQLTLTLPEGFDGGDVPLPPALAGSELVAAVAPAQGRLTIELTSPAFGYIHFPQGELNRIVVDLYPDPLGERWQAPGATGTQTAAPAPAPEPEPDPAPAQATDPAAAPTPAPTPARVTTPDPAPAPPPAPAAASTTQAPAQTPDPAPAPAPAPVPNAGVTQTPESVPQSPTTSPAPASPTDSGDRLPQGTEPGPRQPFYAVPYAVRGQIVPPGQETPQPVETTPAPAPLPLKEPPAAPATRPVSPARPTSEARTPTVQPDIQPVSPQPAPQASAPRPVQVASLESPRSDAPAATSSALRASVVPRSQTEPTPVTPLPAPPATSAGQASTPEPTGSADTGSEPASQPASAQPDAAQPDPTQTGEPIDFGAPGMRTHTESGSPAPDAQADAQPDAQAEDPLADVAADEAQQVDPGSLPERAPDAPAPEEDAEESGGGGGLAEGASALRAQRATPAETDEEGVIIPSETLLQARLSMNNGDYATARQLLETLKYLPTLPEGMREEVLYTLADTVYIQGRDDLTTNFMEITRAYEEAVNHNLESMRVPAALLRQGLVNLKVGNVREAEAYFNILEDKYPYDDNIPLIHYYWGEHWFNQGDYQRAADEFQYVVQQYPDNKFAREASVGLARSLEKLGYYDQAYQIVDYIEKRWPRFYIEFIPFLRLMGDVAYKQGDLEKAKLNYWTYYNLDPQGEETDIVLARLGDIYMEEEKVPAAREVYEKAAAEFPDADGGLIAKMRLAEEGIHDDPSIEDMFSVFDRPLNMRPKEIYEEILQDHADSALAPLAQLKLGMWYLFHNDYPRGLAEVANFLDTYPDNRLVDHAKEVAMRAFDQMVERYVGQENYKPIAKAWSETPILRAQEENLSPKTRIAVALAFQKEGDDDRTLAMLDPIFRGEIVPEYSEMALNLALGVHLERGDWPAIADLGKRIELWDLAPATQMEVDYALALAYENMDQPEEAAPLWRKLAETGRLNQNQQAYAFYFLALDERDQKNLKGAYDTAQEALTHLLSVDEEQRDVSKIKDLYQLLSDVTGSAGRVRESMDWLRKYAEYVEPSSPEYPALRYREAQLHRQGGDTAKWREILQQLTEQNPESLHGRMAASELRTYELEQQAGQYAAPGTL